MRALFSSRSSNAGAGAVIATAHREALAETWGDRLLARALIRVGVHLDETYSRHFNGEPPLATRIRPDRFCSPLVSFHRLATPARMLDAGRRLANATRPVLWADLWDLYDTPSPWRHRQVAAFHQHWDHVGPADEAVLVVGAVETLEGCRDRCERARARTCMAWTWDSQTRDCLVSPWMIVGEAAQGKLSGLNSVKARGLDKTCLHY